jgi:hypothetical protein
MRDGKRRKLGGIQVKACMEANNRGNLQNAITCLVRGPVSRSTGA